jgi:hypothetical protein
MTDTNNDITAPDQDTNAESSSLRTYHVSVIVQCSRTYEVQAGSPRQAVENYNAGDACAESSGEELAPDSVLEERADGSFLTVAQSDWGDAPTSAAPGNKPYSVLLHYPDYLDDTGYETYYAWVEAPDPILAVALAQREAVAANECAEIDDPADFHPLLVTAGHHDDQPLYNV